MSRYNPAYAPAFPTMDNIDYTNWGVSRRLYIAKDMLAAIIIRDDSELDCAGQVKAALTYADKLIEEEEKGQHDTKKVTESP